MIIEESFLSVLHKNMLWVLIRIGLDFMENYSKLSLNYHQIPALSVLLDQVKILLGDGAYQNLQETGMQRRLKSGYVCMQSDFSLCFLNIEALGL